MLVGRLITCVDVEGVLVSILDNLLLNSRDLIKYVLVSALIVSGLVFKVVKYFTSCVFH